MLLLNEFFQIEISDEILVFKNYDEITEFSIQFKHSELFDSDATVYFLKLQFLMK